MEASPQSLAKPAWFQVLCGRRTVKRLTQARQAEGEEEDAEDDVLVLHRIEGRLVPAVLYLLCAAWWMRHGCCAGAGRTT